MANKALALEDKDLGILPQLTLRTSSYKDIDLSFSVHSRATSSNPLDIFKKTDADSVKQAIKNILLTNHYEKPFNPFFGGNVTRLFFELADDITETEVEEAIRQTISNFESRVEILNILAKINPDSNSCNVRIVFRVIGSDTETILDTDISRLR
tara:strand:+ start:12288 stop:12749 length:462 start_codon:yes stop_codon:yes gene_type:complete